MKSVPKAIPEETWYRYYMECYESGIFPLPKLRAKLKELREAEPKWLEKANNASVISPYEKRDYISYKNSIQALQNVIKDIRLERLWEILRPVPESIQGMNLELEAKKITIAHRILHFRIRKHSPGYNDDGLHNVRTFLINRVERASNYRLVVKLNGRDVSDEAKIYIREEYLRDMSCN